MVELFNLKTLNYDPNADFLKYCDQDNYDTFRGISFVSNLKFIEKYLVPRFPKIELILGLSDNGANPIGQMLSKLLQGKQNDVAEIEKSSVLKQRILDGTLTFKFTRKADNLIHSKFYLLTNKNNYSCFIGSMNLTSSALFKNKEMLVYNTGTFDKQYKLFKQAWDNNWASASIYLDAKHLKGVLSHAKTPHEVQVNVYNDTLHDLTSNDKAVGKDVYIASKEDVQKFVQENKGKKFADLDAQTKVAVVQTTKIFGDGGQVRQDKTLAKLPEELIQVQQALVHAKQEKTVKRQVLSDQDLYPRPMLFFNNALGRIYVSNRVGDKLHAKALTAVKPSHDDVKLFTDIVNEYQSSKLTGEGHQACDFLLYLFESPFIWKIRQMVQASSTVRRKEDIPISAALIGSGQSGKSTLGYTLASKLIGETNPITAGDPYFSRVKSRTSVHINQFVTHYMQSSGPVSPIMLDDARTDMFRKPYFIDSLKSLANNAGSMDPMPVAIYTTNTADAQQHAYISNLREVMRRCWYLGFDSDFKLNQDRYIDNILSRANDHFFKYVLLQLQDYLANVSVATERQIEADFLHPVKQIIKQDLQEYGLWTDQMAKYFATNYSYLTSGGRDAWQSLVENKTYQENINFIDNGKFANFPKEIFKKLSDSNSGSAVMHRYFNNLPRTQEISAKCTDAGFDVDVAKFDQYLGRPVLQELYEQTSGIAEEKRHKQEMIEAAKIQNETLLNILDQRDKQQAKQKKQKHGLLHRLFG